jgi:hypothetical protein
MKERSIGRLNKGLGFASATLLFLLACELTVHFFLRHLDQPSHERLELAERGFWRGFRAGSHPPSVYTWKRFGADPFTAPLDSLDRSARFALKLFFFASEFFVRETTADNLTHDKNELSASVVFRSL